MNELKATFDVETKTMRVTFRGETREFAGCSMSPGVWASAYGVFAGKFRSGTKVWPMSVMFWFDSGKASVQSGGFSNKGGAHILVGWYDDCREEYRSQHKGAR